MTAIEYKEKIVVKKTVDVDDRLFNDDTEVWKIANLIVDGFLDKLTNDLYTSDASAVRHAAQRINYAFAQADKILLIRK